MVHARVSLHRTLGALGMMAAAMLATHSARADPYRLVSQDKISLRVVEWRSGEGDLKDWNVFNGVFLVDDSGMVSLPLVGAVEAAGRTTQELSITIADLLQKRAGLANKPSASVEIAQFGPIYVVGAIDKPGQYPYSPDLTVMKAISLAGGFHKDDEPIGQRLERERIQSAGTLGNTQLDYNALLMRRARLLAEKEQKTTFEIPADLREAKGADDLHADETELMRLHQVELDSKIVAAKSLAELYAHEIETLQNKITTQQRQVDLVKKELANTVSLVQKRLVTADRRFLLDRDESESESKLLDLQFQLLRARQLREENSRDTDELVNSRNSDIQTELNDLGRQIAKAEFQIRVARLLVDETDYESQQQASDQLDEGRKVIQFQIARRSADGAITRFAATADTLLQPRDLIEISDAALQTKLGESDARLDQRKMASSEVIRR